MNDSTEHVFPTTGRGGGTVVAGAAREEVVRCQECKHMIGGEPVGELDYCSAFHGWHARFDGFCHMAERRKE